MALNHESQTPQQVMDTTKEAVRVADDLGFDAAWFAEHHFSAFSICGSPLMMAMSPNNVAKSMAMRRYTHTAP